jgi:phospholipid transport system substrate-binding protein
MLSYSVRLVGKWAERRSGIIACESVLSERGGSIITALGQSNPVNSDIVRYSLAAGRMGGFRGFKEFAVLHRLTCLLAHMALCLAVTHSGSVRADQASASQRGAAEVISDVTAQVMTVVAEANTYFDENPDRYYREIDDALAGLVDWRGFATAVMGEYYSRGRAMDQAGRANLKRQRDDFARTLREGLIRSYAKGLLAFGGARMEVQGVEASPQSARVASVTQLVYGEAERVYTIRYQMGQYKDGGWRLRNLIIETINLGEIYRNQFSALARDADDDLDSVIAQWNEAVIEQAEELTGD